jgi:hypothetical protein
MTAIPSDLGDGGAHLSGSKVDSLKSLLNKLVAFATALKGTAPATITSPLGSVVPALTASSNLAAYATSASPTGSENDADRAQMNAMRADLVELRGQVVALRTEVIALRANDTARAGVTAGVTVSADYT